MNDTWIALTRYKLLEDRVRDLRRKAWLTLPTNNEIENALEDAEQELLELKAWIEVTYQIKKID